VKPRTPEHAPHWEVYCGLTTIALPTGKSALGISMLVFLSERDAKAVARVAHRDSIVRVDSQRTTRVSVKQGRKKLGGARERSSNRQGRTTSGSRRNRCGKCASIRR
jgi:hypothetical protein